MKELSIEEKAKRYDEALKVLHKYDGANIMFSQSLKEEMFPELIEREDERIKKRIIEWIEEIRKCNPNNAEHNGDCSEAIAWIEKQGNLMKALQISNARIGELIEENYYLKEKQGEYAKFRDSIQVGDKVTRNQDGVLVNLSQLKRVAKPAEKQGEQKPAEEYNITGIGSKNAQGKLGKMIKNLKPVSEVLEQNFVWSEEEEKMLGVAISDTFGNGHISVSDWLKSLRPQSQWRPSESDIRILEQVIDGTVNPIDYHATLYAILEQLKKLKE